MSDEQTKSDAPEPRKIAPGDKVQVKGGMGPKMIVNERHSEAEIVCVYFDEGVQRFVDKAFHSDALAYFDLPTPGNSEPVQSTRPLTTTAQVLRTAIRNGRMLIGTQTSDFNTLAQCFEALAGEVQAHTGITA